MRFGGGIRQCHPPPHRGEPRGVRQGGRGRVPRRPPGRGGLSQQLFPPLPRPAGRADHRCFRPTSAVVSPCLGSSGSPAIRRTSGKASPGVGGDRPRPGDNGCPACAPGGPRSSRRRAPRRRWSRPRRRSPGRRRARSASPGRAHRAVRGGPSVAPRLGDPGGALFARTPRSRSGSARSPSRRSGAATSRWRRTWRRWCGGAISSSSTTSAATPHVHDPGWFSHAPVVLHLSLRDLSPRIVLSSFNVVDSVEHVMSAGRRCTSQSRSPAGASS